jgi:hypothetical protein
VPKLAPLEAQPQLPAASRAALQQLASQEPLPGQAQEETQKEALELRRAQPEPAAEAARL